MAFVQFKFASQNGDPQTLAFDSNVGAASAITVAVRTPGFPSVITVVGVSDNLGNTYTQLVAEQDVSSGLNTLYLYGAQNIAGGACTVSVDLSASDTCRIEIAEWSGRATSGAFESSAGAHSVAPNATVTTGSITPSSGADVYVAAETNGFAGALTPGTIAGGAATELTGDADIKFYSEYRVNVSAGSTTGTMTTGSADSWAVGATSIKASGATPVTITPPVGSLTLTGIAPSLVRAYAAAMPLGALAITGTQVGVAFDGPDTGVLVLTGFAPSAVVVGNFTITPTLGALAIAGTIATPVRGDQPQTQLGTLTIAGLAPTPRKAIQNVMPAGELTLTGYAPSARIGPDSGGTGTAAFAYQYQYGWGAS